jgi:hypothetical protein
MISCDKVWYNMLKHEQPIFKIVYQIKNGCECFNILQKRPILWIYWRSNFKNKHCLSRENHAEVYVYKHWLNISFEFSSWITNEYFKVWCGKIMLWCSIPGIQCSKIYLPFLSQRCTWNCIINGTTSTEKKWNWRERRRFFISCSHGENVTCSGTLCFWRCEFWDEMYWYFFCVLVVREDELCR